MSILLSDKQYAIITSMGVTVNHLHSYINQHKPARMFSQCVYRPIIRHAKPARIFCQCGYRSILRDAKPAEMFWWCVLWIYRMIEIKHYWPETIIYHKMLKHRQQDRHTYPHTHQHLKNHMFRQLFHQLLWMFFCTLYYFYTDHLFLQISANFVHKMKSVNARECIWLSWVP